MKSTKYKSIVCLVPRTLGSTWAAQAKAEDWFIVTVFATCMKPKSCRPPKQAPWFCATAMGLLCFVNGIYEFKELSCMVVKWEN